MEILNGLYDTFCSLDPQLELEKEVEDNHQILIANLSKEHRRNVLRIIDAQMMITTLRSRESFVCGFSLAMGMLAELKEFEKESL